MWWSSESYWLSYGDDNRQMSSLVFMDHTGLLPLDQLIKNKTWLFHFLSHICKCL